MTGSEDTLGRAFEGFYNFVFVVGQAPPLGIGMGAASVGAVALTTGRAAWTVAEEDLQRNIFELGPAIGLIFVVLRYALTSWLAIAALRSARRGESAPLILFGFVGIHVLTGSITANVTIACIVWLFAGLLMAAARIETPGKSESSPPNRQTPWGSRPKGGAGNPKGAVFQGPNDAERGRNGAVPENPRGQSQPAGRVTVFPSTPSLRLLHIVPTADPRSGGPIEALKQRAQACHALGSQVDIVSLDPPGMPWLDDPETPVLPLGTGNSRFGYSARLRPWLRQHAAAYDAVIVHGLWQYPTLGVWSALRSTGVPYFVFVHGMLIPGASAPTG